MGFLDSIFGGSDSSGGGFSFTENVLPSLITSGVSALGEYFKPDPVMPFENTQAGFEASQQYLRDKLATEYAIAQLQAGAAGAGSGAALQAAKINARLGLAQLKEKQMADTLAAQLGVYKAGVDARQPYIQMATTGAREGGQAAANALSGIGSSLSRFAK